jgi:hypothetical protein
MVWNVMLQHKYTLLNDQIRVTGIVITSNSYQFFVARPFKIF